jgi:hypothetical protein
LVKVEFGRLVDVYGYQQGSFTLYQSDVLVGSDIQDERPNNSNIPDSDILFDFLSANPDTLQPRLFIPREVNSDAFRSAFARLGAQLRQVTPMMFGQGGATQPFTVVPRNAAIQLTFSGRLGIDDGFFVTRNAQGQVDGLRNTEALQLLEIAGDPSQPNGFHALPARFVVSGSKMIIDPVLLGSEGVQYQARNNAAGMPASPNMLGANIRVAIELEGSQAIPGLQADAIGGLEGLNNSGKRSIIRDFRSGNALDDSADIARGFVRDPIPPRLLGEMLMYVERIDSVSALVQQVTVFKNGVNQEIDQGDVFKFVVGNSGNVTATAEVVVKPEDDRDNPSAQHVRVLVRHVPNLEALDPSHLPGYPSNPADLGPWLVQNAPRAILVAEFAATSSPSCRRRCRTPTASLASRTRTSRRLPAPWCGSPSPSISPP